MSPTTEQTSVWTGSFGREYTERSTFTPAELDEHYRRLYGVTRQEMNRDFLAGIPRDARILEVGCNVGNQLLCLEKSGFTRLYGVELQPYAVEAAQVRRPGLNVIQGSACDIPFRDGWFDLVFTSGVLVHLPPDQLPLALGEIHRCAGQFIWGLESFAPVLTEIPYRGHARLMWKADYAAMYRERFPGLELVRAAQYRYQGTDNVDAMFLLKRRAR